MEIVMADAVNHPDHYNRGGIEVIDAIEAWGLGFHAGNVVKYVARAGHKTTEDAVEALRKAKWYLDRMLGGQDQDVAKLIRAAIQLGWKIRHSSPEAIPLDDEELRLETNKLIAEARQGLL
jgi:hypothetical protein